MENQFNSKELLEAVEKISSPTVNNDERVKHSAVTKILEKYCLQQSHKSFRAYERGFGLAKKSTNIHLMKDVLLSYKNYILDNMEEDEKRASYKKLDLIFSSLEKTMDLLEHDFGSKINYDLICFLLGNLVKNIHE
jgi:hypothetical protein